jgi:chaperonin GroEL
VTQLRARKVLLDLKKALTIDDEKMGADILYQALAMPVHMIAQNAGADAGWVVRTIEENKVGDFGYNALTNDFESMLAAGIVDPAKVTRSSLQNGASVAVMVLTTECLVTDLPEKKEAPMMPPGGGMGGMGGGMDY